MVVFVENIGFFIDLEETIEHFNGFEETIENFNDFWWNHHHWMFVGALTIGINGFQWFLGRATIGFNGFQWSETIGQTMKWFQWIATLYSQVIFTAVYLFLTGWLAHSPAYSL